MYKSTGTKLLFFKRLNPAQGNYSTGDEKMEEGLEEILECSCGLDVHKDKIEACILKTGAKAAYRETFGCISSELDRLCRWINEHGCKDIAMESTGVYWLPIYERIEAKCPDRQSLLVVNAYEIKNMPGRKTDIKDAHWIALLLKRGLLRQHNSFIPEHTVRSMREVSRLRRKITGDRSKASNQLEKFLQTHGFKFSSVFSSITGMSSTALLKRLAQRGKLSLRDIYDCCYRNLKHVPEEILAAVNGELNEGAVKKRIENPELHSSFSISRQKIGSGGKKAHTSPYPKRRVFAGNQAAAIFFIFLLWYLYRLWPRATRRSSSFTQRSPFLTILLYHRSYFMIPKQPSAWMDRFIRRRAPCMLSSLSRTSW
jgi:hypothetical protein